MPHDHIICVPALRHFQLVIPAKAGIQRNRGVHWITRRIPQNVFDYAVRVGWAKRSVPTVFAIRLGTAFGLFPPYGDSGKQGKTMTSPDQSLDKKEDRNNEDADQEKPKPTTQRKPQKGYAKICGKVKNFFENPSEVIAAVALIFSIIAATGTVCQARISRDTERRQLRAYVSMSKTNITVDSDGFPIHVDVVIKNDGQTPAYEVIHRSDQKVTESAYGGPFEIQDTPVPSILGPGAENSYGHSFTLTNEQKEAIRTGSEAIWIFGEVKYKDAFRAKRITRYRILFEGSGTIPKEGSFFHVANDGNCADEYCDQK